MKKRNLVLALAFTAAAALTACSGGSGEAASGQNQEEEQAEKEGENEAGEEAREEEEPQEEAAETAKANWTIDEAIANQQRELAFTRRPTHRAIPVASAGMSNLFPRGLPEARSARSRPRPTAMRN